MANNNAIITFNADLSVFEAAKAEIQIIAKACANFIVTKETLPAAEDLAKKAGKVEKLIEEQRKLAKAPVLDAGKQIDERAKEITAELTTEVKNLRNNILEYKRKEEAERQRQLAEEAERQRKLAAEREAEEKKLRDKIATEGENAVTREELEQFSQKCEQEASAVATMTVMSSAKTSGLTKTWTYEITNTSLVPREYLMVNEAAIKAAIKGGTRDIPGVRIFQKDNLTLR